MLVAVKVVFALGKLVIENECVASFGTMIPIRFEGNRALLIREEGGSILLPHLWCN